MYHVPTAVVREIVQFLLGSGEDKSPIFAIFAVQSGIRRPAVPARNAAMCV